MVREWRRLVVAPGRLAPGDRAPAGVAAGAPVAPDLPLEPAEAHYLRRVLRLRPGDRFALVDGAGHLWSATLAPDAPGQPARALLDQSPARPLQSEPPPAPRLALAAALPRQDADVLLRMICELGIDRFTPLRASHAAAGDPLRPQRQAAILREATEQCERLWLPRLEPVQTAEGFLASPPAGAGGEGPVLRLLAATRRADLPSLERLLAAPPPAGVAAEEVPAEVVVAIGPEGGWSPAEEQAAEAAGWQPVSLGATILRTSTAAVGAAALLAAWRRGLSCGTSRPPSP